jgi:hypothetical protein
MIGYLIRAIIQLVIFLGVLYVIPYAAAIAVIIFIIVACIRQMISADRNVAMGPVATMVFVILGFLGIFWGISFMEKLFANEIFSKLFLMAAFCVPPIFGGYISRYFVIADRRKYRMNEHFDMLTAPYPYLLMASGIMRIAIEVVSVIPLDIVNEYAKILNWGVSLGNFMFSIALLMYAVRTAHVFWVNR